MSCVEVVLTRETASIGGEYGGGGAVDGSVVRQLVFDGQGPFDQVESE